MLEAPSSSALRKPATGSFTQIAGCNDSLHPHFGCVAFHDVPLTKRGEQFQPPF